MRLRLKIVYLFPWHIFKARKWWFKSSLGFWRQFFGYSKLCDWQDFLFFFKKNFGLKGVIELMWGLFPCILIFEGFIFLIIKRHYEIENLNFCVKLMRWFAAIHTITTLPFDFCTISKILICFSLIKHFQTATKVVLAIYKCRYCIEWLL